MSPPVQPIPPAPGGGRSGWVLAGILAVVAVGLAAAWFVGPRQPVTGPTATVTITAPTVTVTGRVPTATVTVTAPTATVTVTMPTAPTTPTRSATNGNQSSKDTPAGTLVTYSLLPDSFIVHGDYGIILLDVGSDSAGQYAIFSDSEAKMRIGETRHVENVGTITLLGVLPNPCVAEGRSPLCVGGSGAQATVEYKPD